MTKLLTMELLREFLGGPIEIDNPNCRYCGSPSEVCLNPKDIAGGKIKWIGIRFRWLTEMIDRKPVEGTKKQNCVLEFHLTGKAYTGTNGKSKRECLVVPTDIGGEVVKIMK